MKNLNILQKFFFLGFVILSFSTSAQQKNILIFLVDDLGWQDVSLPFADSVTHWNRLYHTPNLEKLAARGVKFTHAYAHQNCTPSRVSMLTGMNPIHHKVTSWTFQKDTNPKEGGDPDFEVPHWNMNGLSASPFPNSYTAKSLAQTLKEKGYSTIHAGKAHFGAYDTPGANPLLNGFDINIGGTAAGQPASYSGLQNFGNKTNAPSDIRAVPNLERFWGKDIHLTEALTQESMRIMDSVRQNKKPFFMLFSNFAVHTPIQADQRFVNKYYQLGIDSTEAKYASLIEGMDKSLGDWMEYLDKNKLTENTVIIFLSDNGGLTDVGRGKSGRNTYNSPLRSGKTSGYEGGLRIPFVVSGLGHQGESNHQNILVEDVFPTVLEVAKISNNKQLDGKSFLPLIEKKQSNDNRMLIWYHPHMRSNGSKDIQAFSAIRQGQWKLIYFHKDQHFELYNTENDLSESKNLFQENPQKALFLARQLGRQLKKSGSKMLISAHTKREIPYLIPSTN
jgi:arylsulfatase A-like enzyme